MRHAALIILLGAAACSAGGGAGPDAALDAALDAPAPDAGTPGCGVDPSLAPGTWVGRELDVGATRRWYAVRLPEAYDHRLAYPIVYQLHGCSGEPDRETNHPPVAPPARAAAIHVRPRAAGNCWDLATGGPDLAYLDAVRADIENVTCADPARRFVSGYSSGAFMAHRVACLRGELFRAVATIAGGQAGTGCTAPVAALLVHDTDDGVVSPSASTSTRDAHLARNGCATTGATPVDPSPCVAYPGCTAGLPVHWCQTSGRGHDRQDTLASTAFWSFFASLGPRAP